MKEIWDIFKESIKELFNENWAKVKVAFRGFVKSLLDLVLNFLKLVWNVIGCFLSGAWNLLGTALKASWDYVFRHWIE